MTLCDWTMCDIRYARSYTEGVEHAVCEDNRFSVCVPKLVAASENDPQGCEHDAISNFCLNDNEGKIVIEDIQLPGTAEKPGFYKLPGWDLCNCIIPHVNDKILQANSDYVSICYYCGDNHHNDGHNSPEQCDGNWFDVNGEYNDHWVYYEEGKVPCNETMDATGYITCNADCTQNYDDCIAL